MNFTQDADTHHLGVGTKAYCSVGVIAFVKSCGKLMSAVEEAVAQNSVQHIELFKELTGSDGATAERMLAASNGNLQRALDFFFDEQVPLDGATTAVAAPLLPTVGLQSCCCPRSSPMRNGQVLSAPHSPRTVRLVLRRPRS